MYYNGVYDAVFRVTLVDGEAAGEEIVQLIAPPPPPRWPSVITEVDDVIIGPDNIPTTYTSKIEGAITTAYSSSGGRGASGLGLYCGTVAVNPNVIPYGTRMFITAADGSYVYGFAIATDTGIALMDGRIDIDLYFSTNAECLQFGKRAMDVYILD